jgi:PilX N-terminal
MPQWNTAAVRSRMLARLRDERGIALIMALGILFVLTITLTTVIYVTSASARHAEHSNAGQKAYALAEAGVNNALAVLNATYPATFPGPPSVQCVLRQPTAIPAGIPGGQITGAVACPAQSPFPATVDASKPNETVSYWGVLRLIPGLGNAWVIRSTGSVPNPTGPSASPVNRTITAKVPVLIGPQSTGGTGVLDWVYSGTTEFTNSVNMNSPFYVNGDVNFKNSATVNSRLYVTGSVTFEQNGGFTGTKCNSTSVPGCVNIGGGLNFQNTNNSAGTPSAPLPEAHIVGPCTYNATTTSPNPCGSTPPTPAWTSTKVYANVKDNILQPKPFLPMTTSGNPLECANTANYSCIDYASWYYNSSPGPVVPCEPGPNALPSTTFDGNPTVYRSNPTPFNLTPSTEYTCRTPGGELSWDPAGGSNGDGQLTIRGTVFIDGSAYVDQIANRAYSYKGIGTIMLSGSFSMQAGNLCAVLTSNGKQCDLTSSNGWDPKTTALAIVADGTGNSSGPSGAIVPVGLSAYVKTAQYQGILAGTNSIGMETSAEVQGPIMSVFGSVSASQSLDLTFPPIPFAPASSPGQPPPPAELQAPIEFQGG